MWQSGRKTESYENHWLTKLKEKNGLGSDETTLKI